MSASVRQAIQEVLEDADLGESTGVFYRKAPKGTPFPYVVFHKSSGVYIHTFRDSIQNAVWVIKGVSDAPMGAEDLDGLCMSVLHRSKFVIEGRNNYGMLRIGDVSYPEDNDGEQYHHEGGEYRLYSEDSS